MNCFWEISSRAGVWPHALYIFSQHVLPRQTRTQNANLITRGRRTLSILTDTTMESTLSDTLCSTVDGANGVACTVIGTSDAGETSGSVTSASLMLSPKSGSKHMSGCGSRGRTGLWGASSGRQGWTHASTGSASAFLAWLVQVRVPPLAGPEQNQRHGPKACSALSSSGVAAFHDSARIAPQVSQPTRCGSRTARRLGGRGVAP